MRSSTVNGSRVSLPRALLALGVVGITGCVPATRNEPSLEQKCQDLVDYCADVPNARQDLQDCYDVGRRGLREAKQRDQCFVSWDACIDDCEYLYLQRAYAADGG